MRTRVVLHIALAFARIADLVFAAFGVAFALGFIFANTVHAIFAAVRADINVVFADAIHAVFAAVSARLCVVFADAIHAVFTAVRACLSVVFADAIHAVFTVIGAFIYNVARDGVVIGAADHRGRNSNAGKP